MDGIAFLGRSMSCVINYLKKLYSGDTTFCLTILSAFSVFLTLVRVIISGHALSVSCEESDSCNYSMVCFYNHLFRGKQKGFQITCIGFPMDYIFPEFILSYDGHNSSGKGNKNSTSLV